MKQLFRQGDIIKSHWYRTIFLVEELWDHRNGWQVYGVRALQTGLKYAIKISQNLEELTKEHKLIRLLNSSPQIRTAKLIPQVFYLDSCTVQQQQYGFYIADVSNGARLADVYNDLRETELLNLLTSLNSLLAGLKGINLRFKELKPKDFLFDLKNRRFYLIDYSGLLEGKVAEMVTTSRNLWLIREIGRDEKTGVNSRVINAIGATSLLLFLGSLIYYVR